MSLTVAEYFLSETLSVHRPVVSDGKISEPVVVLENVRCSPVRPHDTDYDINEVTETFRAQWTIFTEAADLRIGDVLILDGDTEEYEIDRVDNWAHFLACRVLEQAV